MSASSEIVSPFIIHNSHDLKWIEPRSFVNSLLVFVPPIIWIGVVLWQKTNRAFMALLMIGLFYGIFLGLTHQILWNYAFEETPQLGGNLARIPSSANTLITRVFAFMSSFITGIIIGSITGIFASLINRVR